MSADAKKQGVLHTKENFLDKVAHFYTANEKLLNIIGGAILVVALGLLFYFMYWAPKQHDKAELAIYKAEHYFAVDSSLLALNGDGLCDGLLSVIDKYPCTKTAKRARFMAGASYLKLGDFDQAIKYLKKFSSKDKLLSVQALGLLGDAYLEKNDLSKAASYYKKASNTNANDLLTPMYLLRYGMVLEMEGKWADATEAYKKIQQNYPQSMEAMDIEKRIAYASERK